MGWAPLLSFGGLMAYRMTTHKKDGTIERKRVDGNSVSTFVQKHEGTRGVIVKGSKKREVFHNFHPSLSKQVREAELRQDLDEHRKEYTHTKGMSKSGTMKHVASIPPEIWWSERAERGYDGMRGHKNIKAICDKWGVNVSKW